MAFRPEDDRFHRRNDDPYWNESSWISFMVPQHNINGMVYFYHRPNMSHSAGGPVLWDGNGEEIYDCLYWDWDTVQPLPPGCDMNDFTLENGLTVELVEPLKELKLRYKRQVGYKPEECELDLTWRAIMEPQEMKRTEKGEINPGILDWLVDEGVGELSVAHWEQPGRITGTVRVNDQTYEVDCFSIRDHTWGPRPLHDMPRGGYLWGIESDRDHFLVCAISDLPHEKDPIEGTTEPVVAGWYMKDGVKGNLVSGTRRCVERGPDGRPLREVVDAVDDLGRELHVEGGNRTWMKWTGYSHLYIWWGLAEWNYNGRTALGEGIDYWTFAQNREFMRRLAARRNS